MPILPHFFSVELKNGWLSQTALIKQIINSHDKCQFRSACGNLMCDLNQLNDDGGFEIC
jgi:hypothetical protein